jgi:hypothetical protein
VAVLGWWPLRGGEAPWGHDSLMHLHRIAAVHRSWLEGNFHPRWFEGFFYGYGYPVLHFYAPLSYYLGALFRLLGAEVSAAFGLVVLLARLGGALGAFLLGRRLFGTPWSGAVTGAAFALLPYQLTEVYVRAALAELLALSLLPWALWAVDRVAGGAGRRAAAVAGLLLAGLVLAHQTTALVTTAAVAAFGAARLVGAPRRALGWLAAAGVLGAALSAYFWIGIVADGAHVTLAAQPPGFPPFTGHLFPLERLLQGTTAASYAWPEVVQLPRVELLLVAVGGIAALLTRRHRGALLLALAAWLVAALLMTEPARPLWEAFPTAQLMQYPFRLRMVTTMAVALLVGGLPWRPAALAALALVAWASLAAWQPLLTAPEPSSFDAGSFARYELVPYFPETGTTVPAQFKPKSARLSQEELKQSRVRPDAAESELGARVELTGRGATELRLHAEADEAFRLTVHQFWFPGWRAWVDGLEVPTAPAGERGLVAVDVPAGSHELRLRWQDDPRWSGAALLSAAALVVVGWLLAGRSGGAVALAALVAAAILGGRLAESLPTPVRPADAAFAGGLSLVGWSATPRGELLDVELWWLARRGVTADHAIEMRVADDLYRRAPNWGSTPTSTWGRGELVHDRHTVPMPSRWQADVPLAVGLVGAGPPRPVGSFAWPATVQTTSDGLWAQPPRRFADGLTLVSWHAQSADALPRGATLPVELAWRVDGDVPHDAAVSVFLADRDGTKHALRDTYPPHDLRFSAAWPRGTVHQQRLDLPVDAELPMGVYDLSVELYDYSTGQRVPLADGAATRLPLRRYKAAAPASATPAGLAARFDDGVALADHAVRRDGDAIVVELRWAATGRPSRDYTVFLHLYDAAGALLAQRDGPPLEGRYPTSLWDAGELVAESRRVTPLGPVPAGARLKVGLYAPADGARLPTAEGRDGVELGPPPP